MITAKDFECSPPRQITSETESEALLFFKGFKSKVFKEDILKIVPEMEDNKWYWIRGFIHQERFWNKVYQHITNNA